MNTRRVRFAAEDVHIILPPPKILPSPLMTDLLTRGNIPIPRITLDPTTRAQPALVNKDLKAMNVIVEGTDLSVRIVTDGACITIQQFLDELLFVLPMEFLSSTIRSVSPCSTGLIVCLDWTRIQ